MVVYARLVSHSGHELAEAMDMFCGMLFVLLEDRMPCQTMVRDYSEDTFKVELDYDGSKWDDQTPEMLDVWDAIETFIGLDFGFEVEFFVDVNK